MFLMKKLQGLSGINMSDPLGLNDFTHCLQADACDNFLFNYVNVPELGLFFCHYMMY